MGSRSRSQRAPQRPAAPPPAPAPPSTRHARALAAVGLVVIIAFVVGVRIALISIPFERDEGDYFYLGQLVLDGKTPYVSFYEQKLPGLFYAYALMILLFGHTVEGAHLGFLLVNVVTILVLYAVATKLLDRSAGIVGAATFALLSLGPRVSGFTTQSEHLVVLLSTSGLLLLLHAEGAGSWWRFLSSGAAFGAAFLIKPNALCFVLFGAVAILGRCLLRRPVTRHSPRDALAYLAGAAAVFLVAIIPVVAGGALHEMWYWTWVFPRHYVSQVPWSVALQFFAQRARAVSDGYASFWLVAACGLALMWVAPVATYTRLVIALLAGFSFLAIVPGLRFYGHYWIQLLPAAALATAVAFHAARELLGRRLGSSTTALLLAGAYAGAAAANVWAERAYYFHPDPTRILHEVYDMNPFPEAKVVGEFVKSHTAERDRIVVLGSEPEIYFYADRRAATRHHYLAFLMGDRTMLPRSTALQQELISDVSAALPKYVIFVGDPISWLAHPNADRSILSWFGGFVAEHYRLVGLVDLISPYETQYRWYGELDGYEPRGRSVTAIYERKDSER